MVKRAQNNSGFTLIELSIVLVIIGLLVGGVLVGQDLIKAAELRATLSQLEKFNTAKNTFYGKYGALPGDMNDGIAQQFGFTPRGTLQGEGDGNGLIEGASGSSSQYAGYWQGQGETAMFWVDLTTANGMNLNLIEGSFSLGRPDTYIGPSPLQTTNFSLYLPAAKIGNGNYFYVWSGGANQNDAVNYYGLSAPTFLTSGLHLYSKANLTVGQAYTIDKKIDDGMPQTGSVTAMYISANLPHWVQGDNGPADISSTYPVNTSCYDDGGTPGNARQYSVNINANIGNCALSFRMQ